MYFGSKIRFSLPYFFRLCETACISQGDNETQVQMAECLVMMTLNSLLEVLLDLLYTKQLM